MDRRVVEKDRGNRRPNLLASIDDSPRRMSGRCLTTSRALRKSFSLKWFGGAAGGARAVFRSVIPFRTAHCPLVLETWPRNPANYLELQGVLCSFR